MNSPAMAAALDRIEREFGDAAVHRNFKNNVRRLFALGADSRAVHARFGARAYLLRHRPLDSACQLVGIWVRQETASFAVACAYGRGSRLSLTILDELALILRWMRRKGMADEFRQIVRKIALPPSRPIGEAASAAIMAECMR